MTSSVQKSSLLEGPFAHSYRTCRRHSVEFSYMVIVEDFDGCEYQYDVEAESYEAAAAKVEMMAAESMIQVYNMNIYLVA